MGRLLWVLSIASDAARRYLDIFRSKYLILAYRKKRRNIFLSRDRRQSCWDSNRECPEYKSRVMTLHEPAYVYENLICDCVTLLPAQLGTGLLTWTLKLTPSLSSAGCRAPSPELPSWPQLSWLQSISPELSSWPVSLLSWLQGSSPELSSWPRLSPQLGTEPLSVQVDPCMANEKIPFSVSECRRLRGEPAAGGWGSRSRPIGRPGALLLNALHQSWVDRVRQSVAVC
jgi:hypothetical protein